MTFAEWPLSEDEAGQYNNYSLLINTIHVLLLHNSSLVIRVHVESRDSQVDL